MELGKNPISRHRRRQYTGECAVASALNFVGQRWGLPVLTELQFGPRRFGQLRDAIPGISATMLAARLVQLEECGLVRQGELPPPALISIYELTESGRAVRSFLVEMARWSLTATPYIPAAPMSPASLMILLLAAFDPPIDKDHRIQFFLNVDFDCFALSIGNRQLDIVRTDPSLTHANLAGSASALAKYLVGQSPLQLLEAEGRLMTPCDPELVRRLPTYFAIS